MTSSSRVGKIAFLGDYPPRQCGIATFTRDLRDAVAGAQPTWACPVLAVSDRPGAYSYPSEVRFEIPQQDAASYRRAADFLALTQPDILCLQHEFGIFGGPAGRYLLDLLRRARMPVVTTMHTVLEKPDADQRRVFDELLRLSTRVVVMAEKARNILQDVYSVDEKSIAVIPHGIPDIAFTDPSFFKDQFDVAGRDVMLTFGLLSPNKGIEYAIEALPRLVARHPRLVYLILGATHPNLRQEEGEAYRHKLESIARSLGVEENVIFINRYVSNEELCQYIGAADIYVTPYLNEAQITSGTLSYCFGAGKAVVSTPYWHAAELLGNQRGMLVPFRNAEALARAIDELLSDKEKMNSMRKQAYLAGREMVWAEVARRYSEVFVSAAEKSDVTRTGYFFPGVSSRRSALPAWRFDHLLRMSDHTGIYQHAIYSLPWYEHGYCTDDNARALLLSVLLEASDNLSPDLGRSRSAYAAFLHHAFAGQTGRFRNFLGFDRRWLDECGSEDSHGRALWALGAVIGRTRNEHLRAWATPLFETALPAAESFASPRAWAFTVLGLHEYLRALDGDLWASGLRKNLANRLFALWQQNATEEWPWFEDTVAYDNARLSHALILTGRWISNQSMKDAGLRSLRWLTEHQQGKDGVFRPVGSNGFWSRGRAPAVNDQQPLEAAAAVSACLEAYHTTEDTFWHGEARRAYDWFLGSNDLGLALYDPTTGGCRDGLHANRMNQNQGAESTLSFWLASAEMREFENSTQLDAIPAPLTR